MDKTKQLTKLFFPDLGIYPEQELKDAPHQQGGQNGRNDNPLLSAEKKSTRNHTSLQLRGIEPTLQLDEKHKQDDNRMQ